MDKVVEFEITWKRLVKLISTRLRVLINTCRKITFYPNWSNRRRKNVGTSQCFSKNYFRLILLEIKNIMLGKVFDFELALYNAIPCNTLETESRKAKSQKRPLNLWKPYFLKRNKRKPVVSDQPRGKNDPFFIFVLLTSVDYNTR